MATQTTPGGNIYDPLNGVKQDEQTALNRDARDLAVADRTAALILDDPDFAAGITGPAGPAPDIYAGTTTQVDAGTPASVDIVETGEGVYRADFTIPKGADGDGTGMDDASVASHINTMGSSTQTALNAQIDDATPGILTQAGSVTRAPAPAWSGTGRQHSWDPTLCLYNGESPALREVRRLIRRGLSGTGNLVRMVGVGSSVVRGIGAAYLPADSWPAQLTELLGAQQGFIPASGDDPRWVATGGITPAVTAYSNHYRTTGGAWALTYTPAPGEVFAEPRLIGSTISGSGSVTVKIDGVEQAVWNHSNSMGARTYVNIADVDAHVIELSGTASGSETIIAGWEPNLSTGLTISNQGRAGSSAADWLWDDTGYWSRLFPVAFQTQAGNLFPERPAIALVETGLNGSTPTDITTLIDKVVALGDVVPVLIVPGGATPGTHPDQYAAMYAAADTHDLPLIDLNAQIGWNTDATAKGLVVDQVHPSTAGYTLHASLIHRVLTAS